MWEEVGRWVGVGVGSERSSVPEVKSCLQLLMQKVGEPVNAAAEGEALKPPPLHFLSLSPSLSFTSAPPLEILPSQLTKPHCSLWLKTVQLCNLHFQLVLRKSLFRSRTPTQAALLLLLFLLFFRALSLSPHPLHFHCASSVSFAFLP